MNSERIWVGDPIACRCDLYEAVGHCTPSEESSMKTASPVRRCLGGAFAAAVVGGVLAAATVAPQTPSATAAADPCAASEVARTIGSVATSMGNYLDAHPETNTALTTISQQQAGAQSLGALKAYFDANPQAAKDLQTLQAPLQGLSARCRLPLTLPQVMGLLQGAQQSPTGAVPGVPSSPAAVIAPGTGPLPGSSTATYR